jgi:hypothetical protein
MLRQSFGKVMLVSHEQRSYVWKLTDSGVKSGYLIGWHAHFHGYGNLRRICGEDWRICRFRGSVWAFWLNHLKKFCTVMTVQNFFKWFIRWFNQNFFKWFNSQREVFVNTALVFTSECLLFRTFTITSDFYRRYLETFSTMFSCDCGKRFGISIQRLYTELEKNIDASRTNLVDKLQSGAINNTNSLARNFCAESYC